MYRFIPQKKRSRLRVTLGVVFYSTIRYFLWLRYSSLFAKKTSLNEDEIEREFPFVIASHSSLIFKNLSKEDTELQQGKAQNLSIAIKNLNGTLVRNGKIFSYWSLVGNPTLFKGYTKGMMLVNGKPVAKTGGGLCALSNLIYWMTLHTPLDVVERFRHSYDVFPDSNRALPFGSGATCVYNYRDLMIKNSTGSAYFLKVWIKDGRLCGQWRSNVPCPFRYEVYQKDHWITSEIGGKYVRHNTIYRKTFNAQTGQMLSDQLVTENHALMMYEPLIASTNSSEINH